MAATMGGGGVTRKDRKEREGKVDTHGRAQKKSREPRERRLEQELPAGSTTKCLSERAHAHSIAALPRHIALNSEIKKRRRKKRGLIDRILIRLTRTENSFAFIVTIHLIPPTSVLYCAPKAAYRSIARSWVSFLITFTAFFVPMLTK